MNYGLYQTLNQNLPDQELSSDRKRRLIRRLKKIDDQQKEAVLLLICEHASLNDGYLYKPNELILPYGLNETERGLEFDLEKLPPQLQHILKKFSDMIRQNKKRANSDAN